PSSDTDSFSEDVRADAAIDIFPNYWRFIGKRGLPQIKKVANHIGDTGEYPYSAMGAVAANILAAEGMIDVEGILKEATKYYRQEQGLFGPCFSSFIRSKSFTGCRAKQAIP